jgi:hypothetical protein
MGTESWKRDDMIAIKRQWNTLDFKFINVRDIFDNAPSILQKDFEDADNPLSSIEYKRMCHFFFKGFTEVPLLMQYKYLLRLDEDTCLLDSINYDLFRLMEHRGTAYAYTSTWSDDDSVVRGLYQFLSAYIEQNNVTVSNEGLNTARLNSHNFKENCPAFNTNLEVIDTVRYRDPLVLHFVEEVVHSNFIFHRRWGDAPLRFVTALLFWTEHDLLRMDDFEHRHSDWDITEVSEFKNNNNPF